MLGKNGKIIKLYSKNYGKVYAYYDAFLDRVKKGYIVRTIKKGKMLSGYIDLNKKLIIDFDELAFDRSMSFSDKKDSCLTFKMPNGLNKYYHIREVDNKYKIILTTSNENPVIITKFTNVEKYWQISTINEDPSFVLYNYKSGKITTTYLDHIELVEGHDIHKFYFEKELYGVFEGEEFLATTLCGFLDKDCNLSSHIYDLSSGETVYDANLYRNTLTQEFQNLCVAMIRQYTDKHMKKDDLDNTIIGGLYDNPVILDNKEVNGKVYQFNRKKV